MLLAPSVQLSARTDAHQSRWELGLRYGAATAATLLAIAGAQLQISSFFSGILALITLIGVPVSLWLRLSGMRVGSYVVPRPLLNSLTVLGSFGAAFYFVFLPMSDFFGPLLSGHTSPTFWMSFGGGEPITALMQLFLLFAAFRSFAIISDKDATLTTVPSFSVLLLMIPIHRGVEVVVYFVAWTFVAATLLALDHRSEVREGVSATIPAIIAGQDVRLGARSLTTILGISLAAATGISIFLASRDPEERSVTESAITALATRLTNMALRLPEVSTNGGPERQIDFKNGPSLPSRAMLWQVEANTLDRQQVRPAYWRMFTLSNYNGVSWTQSKVKTTRVPSQSLDWRQLLSRHQSDIYPTGGNGSNSNSGNRGGGSGNPSDRGGDRKPSAEAVKRDQEQRPRRERNDQNRIDGGARQQPLLSRFSDASYDLESANKPSARQFAKSGVVVRQNVTSMVPNIGFLPLLPGVFALRIPEDTPKEIRFRSDDAIDIGVVKIGQRVPVFSEVPPLSDYGIKSPPPPSRRLSAAQIAASGLALSAQERAADLRLPATVPARVRALGTKWLGRVSASASNYSKAQRLALAIQQDATYTLRPPAIPEGRDATDFFLFEGNKRGYCTYFAGALTVLCRSQGIPARVVSGFAGMDWSGSEAGLLREGNAHAWTEVWVEGFGWVVVDATPADERGDNAPTWIESWVDWTSSHVGASVLWLGNQKSLLGIGALALLAAWFTLRSRSRRLGRGKWHPSREADFERRAVAQIYRRAARQMARKFRPKSPWETPDEWLQSCASELSMADTEALRRLTALYLAACYGGRELPRGSARLASQTAGSLAWKRVKTG